MESPRSELFPIRSETDVVRVRQTVRNLATQLKFTLVDQTKLVTATSEIARNTLTYGGGGEARIDIVQQDGTRPGLKIVFEDRGPGIADVPRALSDGFTTGGGMGLGLGGAKRLVNEFEIHSRPGEGTRITLVKWK
jgi:serine/threonine-protein kinase RsbT